MAAGYRVKIAGEDLGPFLPGRIDLKAAFAIKATSGLAPVQVLVGVERLDPEALQVLAWFMSTHSYDEATQRYVANGKNVEAGAINFTLEDFDWEPLLDEAPAPKSETSKSDESATSSS